MADKEDFDLLVISVDKEQMKTLKEASKYTIFDSVEEYIINIMMTVSNGILKYEKTQDKEMILVDWKM